MGGGCAGAPSDARAAPRRNAGTPWQPEQAPPVERKSVTTSLRLMPGRRVCTSEMAPAMCGDHGGNRQTYGHALIVDPWGEVLADAGEEPGIIYAEIDPARVAKIRNMMPSLQHDRPYSVIEK